MEPESTLIVLGTTSPPDVIVMSGRPSGVFLRRYDIKGSSICCHDGSIIGHTLHFTAVLHRSQVMKKSLYLLLSKVMY